MLLFTPTIDAKVERALPDILTCRAYSRSDDISGRVSPCRSP